MSSNAQPFWARLPFGRAKAEAQVIAVEDATLRSDRFRIAREGEWRRLEAIVTAIEKGRLRRVSDEDLLALPALYRTLASSLAVARETTLDAATIAYLEALAQRAWFIVYGPRASLGAWLARFFGGGWGEAVRAIRVDVFIALATMIAGVVVGWLLVRNDVQWYYALVPGQFTDERVPGASRAVLQHTLFGHSDQSGLAVMASYLFSNNGTVSILAFALGFAFGLPTLMLLLQNTAIMGAMLWLYSGQGLLFDFSCWLAVHGTTELYAILLAGAAGLHVGRAMVFPGTLTVLDAAAAAGRRAATVMVGVVMMLIVAALLEAFARQLVDTSLGRLAIGLFMLVFWTAYLFVWRRRPDGRAVLVKIPHRRQTLKAAASDRAIDTHDRRRTVITAEGLRLPFLLASRAARGGALAIDLVLIVLLMVGTTVLLVWLARAISVDLTRIGMRGKNGPGLTFEVLAVFWFIAMFLFRHAYFLFFELGPRGATPGKRLAGIRVAARASNGSGGRLTTEAVIARNLIRDIELFLPIVFVIRAYSEGGDTDLAGWASLAWFAVFVLFPFFNKDRLRCGDVIAGTWVVEAPRNTLKQAISTRAAAKGSSTETGATYRFGAVELAVYGEFELKVLEGVLHDRQDEAMRQVAASIARKIGWDAGAGDEAAFLEAYYTQLRARLEGDMRFGKRKKDKFAG